MNPFAIAQTAAQFAVSIGAGAVVGNAIKSSIPANAKTVQKVSLVVGGFVLSSMVGDLAAAYTKKNIDSTVAGFKQAKSEAKASATTEPDPS